MKKVTVLSPPGRSLYEKHLIKTGVDNGASEGFFLGKEKWLFHSHHPIYYETLYLYQISSVQFSHSVMSDSL